MALSFGTSGVRGLVTEMTDLECSFYTTAFARYVRSKCSSHSISLAGDLRPSTPGIMRAVAFSLAREGMEVDFCGFIATPALTFQGICKGHPSIMVTGSHVPEDRNGIKFNMPWGEVLKDDEIHLARIYEDLRKATDMDLSSFDHSGSLKPAARSGLGKVNREAEDRYINRYLHFFPQEGLRGMRIVLYQHSSVSRDTLQLILKSMKAEVVTVGRSASFVPVDTEAIDNTAQLASWVAEHAADALVSTDGDADRPLVVDETGRLIRGDVLGILVSRYLGADAVSTPVSCNTALEQSGYFSRVDRTRIGSPYVIASMIEAIERGFETVVGYEANGGYLLASPIVHSETRRKLEALPTRDAILPILSILYSSQTKGLPLSELVARLPQTFTYSGLLRGTPAEKGRAFVARFEQEGLSLATELFAEKWGRPTGMDFTDGARISFDDGIFVHLRPSGNAPEFRCYTEANSEDKARQINNEALHIVDQCLGNID